MGTPWLDGRTKYQQEQEQYGADAKAMDAPWGDKYAQSRLEHAGEQDEFMRAKANAMDVAPGMANPAVSRWQDAAFKSASALGANPAAAAAMGMRARTTGYQRLARIAPDFWQRLMNQALSTKQEKDSIHTTTTENAFLQGFLGSGGGQGLGGMLGGGGGSQPAGGGQSQSTGGGYYPYDDDWWSSGG